jgi:polyphenol oxidase
MDFILKQGLEFAQFKNLSCYPELFHSVTTRTGGVSTESFNSLNLGGNTGDSEAHVEENYARLSRAMGFDLQSVVSAHQAHGTEIAVIDKAPVRSMRFPSAHALDGYDGFITAVPNIPLLVRVADCVPVILYEPDKKALAVVHAGWKGTAGGIAAKAAVLMVEHHQCDIKKIRAGIGPSIGPCCYEVRQDVAECFRNAAGNKRFLMPEAADTIFSLDLQEANRQQLIESGLTPGHIEVSWLCTACNLNLFFSHRGEKGKTGRFALIAGLRS